MLTKIRSSKNIITLASIGALLSSNALASGTGMPWEGPLQQVLGSLQGPVVSTFAVIAVIGTGLGMAFGEGGSGMKKLFMVLFGASIAFAAATFFLPFFGFSGGALM